MRIRIFATPEVKALPFSSGFFNILTSRLGMINGWVVTENQPDIVHIIGCWNMEAHHLAKRMYNMRIPYIYNTMEGLMPWNKNKCIGNLPFFAQQKEAISHAALVLVGGEMEKTSMEELGWNHRIAILANPLTTKSITESETMENLLSYYEQVANKHDLVIRNEIAKEVNLMSLNSNDAQEVMSKFLYAQYLCRRKMISQRFLDEFSQTLTKTNYDEDLMKDMLQKKGLLLTASRIEQVMEDESTLTEGFMPIPARNDKETDKIKTYIL